MLENSNRKSFDVKKNFSYHCQQLQEDNCKETTQGYDQLHPARKVNIRFYSTHNGRLVDLQHNRMLNLSVLRYAEQYEYGEM